LPERGGAADAATGANQPAGMFVETEDLLPEETGDKKGAGQRQDVDGDTADADIGDLGERQAKPYKMMPSRNRCCLAKITPSQDCQSLG
jgi:hypothetical protein